MYTKEELCRKITEMYPDIGECNIEVDITHDDKKSAWLVDLKKDDHTLTHHLEYKDADDCLEGKQCVALGLEIAQLKKNIAGEQY